MQSFFITANSNISKKTIKIIPIITDQFDKWLKQQNTNIKNWLKANKFRAKSGSACILPDSKGQICKIFLGITAKNDFWAFGALPLKLPEGIYQIESDFNVKQLQRAIIAWGLGCYKFKIYTKNTDVIKAKLVISKSCNQKYIISIAKAIFWVRDLINHPAENKTPEILGLEASILAKKFGAKITQIIGDDLLKNGFNAIHAVGRASVNKPRLIDLRWGDAKNSKVTLVGKGVCFDSGGLDLKSSSGMLTMKKDMAGAAHVLGLASMIMEAKLPINLRVLIPAVENMPSGNAYKPGDILKTYKGISVEIGNTDAEGRLILADVLALACEESPALLIDFASLTGAARIALGTDIAAMFTNNDNIAKEIIAAAEEEQDPVWRLPIFEPYKELLDSDIADINNVGKHSYGGAINAAIFLQEFITPNTPWIHFDIMGSNLNARPARPKGGEAQGLRAVFAYLCQRFVELTHNPIR